MAAGWTDNATRALLSVWGEQNVQEQLDGVSETGTYMTKYRWLFATWVMTSEPNSAGLRLSRSTIRIVTATVQAIFTL